MRQTSTDRLAADHILQSFADSHSSELSACQALWQEVLLMGILNAHGRACDPNRASLDRHQSDQWIRSNCKDFRMVCDLAGMDSDFVHEAYVSGRIDIDGIATKGRGGKGAS